VALVSRQSWRVGTRPGFGAPHPGLEGSLRGLTPAAVQVEDWGFELEVSAYVCGHRELLVPITAAARCVVRVGSDVLVCETPRDAHIFPGGRIEPGETMPEAAAREVAEETGWVVEPTSLRMLGFIHLHHVVPLEVESPFPSPDFLHVVYTGAGTHRLGNEDEDWTDVEGWEQRSRPVPVDEANRLDIGDVCRAFLSDL
jgi:8-oxo-dGTP pyrophosphatase MutT (NUDIX family)